MSFVVAIALCAFLFFWCLVFFFFLVFVVHTRRPILVKFTWHYSNFQQTFL